MTLDEFISILVAFPTNVFFIPFAVVFVIMLADLVFNIMESVNLDVEFLDFDNLPGAGLLLPPVLSKVPLMVALCVSLFFATILSFYATGFTEALIPGWLQLAVQVVAIPCIAYLSLAIAAWVLKPLAPLFDRKKSFARVSFIGRTARVHSGKVTREMGEVVVLQDGNEFLLDALTEQDGQIEYGEKVVIVAKDSTTRRYIVAKI